MRTEGQIRHKFKQAKFRHFQKRAKAAFKKVPCNCKYNSSFVSNNGKTVGMCHYTNMCALMGLEVAEDWDTVICDNDMPEGLEQAKSCSHFQPRQSKQDIKNKIDVILEDQPLHIVAEHFPDLVALLWALGEENEVNEWLTGDDSWVEIPRPLSPPNGKNGVVQSSDVTSENHIAVVVEDPPVALDLVETNDDGQIELTIVDGNVIVGVDP